MTQVLEPPPANGEVSMIKWRGADLVVTRDTSQFSNLLDTAKFAHAFRLAELFASSSLVPQHFQGKPNDCFIGLQMALRLGVDPLMFLQNTYIVHGRPGMEAKLAIALINSSGLFTDSLDYEVQGEDPSDAKYRVRAFATRKSTGKAVNGPWVDWKIVRAERWDGKDGSKWKTIPGLMFQYRAATFFGRLHCPERLMGMQTLDELVDQGTAITVTEGTQIIDGRPQRGAAALAEKLKQQTDSSPPESPVATQPAPEPATIGPDSSGQAEGDTGEQQAQDDQRPATEKGIPEHGRTSAEWIDDLVLSKKPGSMSKHAACAKFHAIHAPASWANVPHDEQDRLYADLVAGEIKWS